MAVVTHTYSHTHSHIFINSFIHTWYPYNNFVLQVFDKFNPFSSCHKKSLFLYIFFSGILIFHVSLGLTPKWKKKKNWKKFEYFLRVFICLSSSIDTINALEWKIVLLFDCESFFPMLFADSCLVWLVGLNACWTMNCILNLRLGKGINFIFYITDV